MISSRVWNWNEDFIDLDFISKPTNTVLVHNPNFLEKDIIVVKHQDIEYIDDGDSYWFFQLLIDKVRQGKKIVFFASDQEKPVMQFYNRWKDFIDHPNVNWFWSNYDVVNDFPKNDKLYLGQVPHACLHYVIQQKNYNHYEQNHEISILSLNNSNHPVREELHHFYQTLPDQCKQNMKVSFNFKNVILEEELFDDSAGRGEQTSPIHHYDLYEQNVIEFYKKCLMEVIVESNAACVSEKTYKPLLLGVPFVLMSDVTSYGGQLGYLNKFDIDINYFNLNLPSCTEKSATDETIAMLSLERNNIIFDFIKEVTTSDINELKEKWKEQGVFEKARDNQTKIRKVLDSFPARFLEFDNA